MASGGPPFYGRWPVSAVYEAVLDGNWVSATPEFSVTWSPEPAGTPFTTGLYSGVDFTASATVTVTGGGKDFEYVVLAGGASGGSGPNATGGGGGAGGYRTGTLPALAEGPYTVTVGAGGAGLPYPTVSSGNSGSPSVFGPITSTGGGGGGQSVNTSPPALVNRGFPGGSGGGGGGFYDTTSPAGTGIPGQGYPGGTGFQYLGAVLRGGGGGGAGGAGTNGGPPSGGSPGPGVTVSTTGTPFPAGVGGGTRTSVYPPFNGTANQGGGGPAGAEPNFASGSGGSGRVIIRWLT